MLTSEKAAQLPDERLVQWAQRYGTNNKTFLRGMLPLEFTHQILFDLHLALITEMGQGYYDNAVRMMADALRQGIARYRDALGGFHTSQLLKPIATETPCPGCKGTGFAPKTAAPHAHGEWCSKQDNEMFYGSRSVCPMQVNVCRTCEGLGEPL